jgi:hypothetical protein
LPNSIEEKSCHALRSKISPPFASHRLTHVAPAQQIRKTSVSTPSLLTAAKRASFY